MPAINLDAVSSPYSTTMSGTEGFTFTRAAGLDVYSLTSGLTGPCYQNGPGVMIWFPQVAGQQFFGGATTTTYYVANGTLALFKGQTYSNVGIANYTIAANLATTGNGWFSAQNDGASAATVITVTGTLSGVTSVSPDSTGAGFRVYVKGTLNAIDLPSQLTLFTAGGNSATAVVTNNSAPATYPTLIQSALLDGFSGTHYLKSNGTQPISFGHGTHGSLRRTAESGAAASTFVLAGTNTGLNTMLYGTTVTVGSMAFKKQEAGRWVLAGNNSVWTSTAVEAGFLRGTHASAFGGNIVLTSNAVVELANNITVANTMTLNGDPSATGALTSVSGSNIASGTLTVGSGTSVGASSGATLTVSGSITGGGGGNYFATRGAGTVALTGTNKNFNVAGFFIANAVTEVQNISATGSIGTGSNDIILVDYTPGNGTTLRYTGTTNTATTRSLRFWRDGGAGVAVTYQLESSGTGAPSYTASGAIPFQQTDWTANPTLELTGTQAGATLANMATLGQGLADPNAGAKLGLTKSGTGTWRITAATNNTGPTTISGGTLVGVDTTDSGASPRFGSGNVSHNAGTLRTGAGGGQLGRMIYPGGLRLNGGALHIGTA